MDGHFMCNHSERANKSVSHCGLSSEETEGRTKKIRTGHSPNIMVRGAAATARVTVFPHNVLRDVRSRVRFPDGVACSSCCAPRCGGRRRRHVADFVGRQFPFSLENVSDYVELR